VGDQNDKPRSINGVEGALGQLMQAQGPDAVEKWVNPSDIGVDYGLSFIGTVTGVVGAPKFQCSGLIGFGEDFFKGYWAYVVWDADDIIGLRLRRIAAAAPECGGEIVINHYGLIFRSDKLGVTTP